MTQNERILAYLKEGHTLTGLDALEFFGCFRLASRISDIKRDNPGIDIRDDFVHKNGKSFKKYWLHKEKIDYDMFLSEQAALEHHWAKKQGRQT
jgi:hypothetical protein